MRSRWVLVFLLPIAAAAVGATLYKWVDEKGVTHYTETPPAKQKAQEIRIQPPPPSGAVEGRPPQAPVAPAAEGSKAAPPKTWHEKALDAQRQREAAEQQEEREHALAQEIAQKRKERCLAAQQNLQALLTSRPVYHVNERGERVFIDDAKRAAEIARAKREIQSYCESRPE